MTIINLEVDIPEGYECLGWKKHAAGTLFFDLEDNKVKTATYSRDVNVIGLERIGPKERTFVLDRYEKRHVTPGDYYSRSLRGTIARKVGNKNTDGTYYVWKEKK